VDGLPDLGKIIVNAITQCGVLEGMALAAVFYLAKQLADTRKGWESDRASLMQLIKGQSEALERINVNRSQIDGIREAMGLKPKD
jgi:hypothetical protein